MPSPNRLEKKFSLGRTVTTQGALAQLTHQDMLEALHRHHVGDWGDLAAEDKRANDAALKEGGRLLSSYQSASGVKFWIITEWDRSVTTVLLPSEY